MRNLFFQLSRSGLFHLAAWVATGFVGAVERLNSPGFDSWLLRNAVTLQGQGYEPSAFDLLGTAPLFVLVVETIAAVLALGIFALIQMLLKKRLPTVIRRSVLLFAVSFVIYTGYLAVAHPDAPAGAPGLRKIRFG